MQEHIEVLSRLVQIDIDAASCYDQALNRVTEGPVAGVLRTFRMDHQRHIDELSGAIRQLGGEPPRQADLSGRMLSGMTGLMAATGTVSALTVMESNEIVTSQAYEQALQASLPEHLRQIVARGREDERRHLERIREMLGERGTAGQAMRAYGTFEGSIASAWMNSVRHHPWTALLVAAAAGVVVAGLLTRRGTEAAGQQTRFAEPRSGVSGYPGYQPQPAEQQQGYPLH